jgi:hypothetical protein
MNYFFRFVSLLWHVLPPFLIQLYSFILTLQLDQFLGSRSISTAPKETIQELQKHLQKAVRYQQAKIQKELRKITSDFIEVYALMKQ